MCVAQIYKSPINYTGNKYRLLKQFKEYFPKKVNKCVDLFTGGATVAINIDANEIIAIDSNEKVINLLNFLRNQDYNILISSIDKMIKKYNLSNSYEKGYSFYKEFVEGNNGLKKYNLEGYANLKKDYNNLENKDTDLANLMLYLLIVYGFNNDIRFNSSNKFNLPVGKTDMNKNNREKLKKYIEVCKNKNLKFLCEDFKFLDLRRFKNVDFVYADPPYLITDAVYNETSGWNEDSEKELLKLLDKLDKKGIKFALSNVLQKKNSNIKNQILYDWLEKNKEKYYINYMNYHYRSSSYNKKDRDCMEVEVLITNYKLEA